MVVLTQILIVIEGIIEENNPTHVRCVGFSNVNTLRQLIKEHYLTEILSMFERGGENRIVVGYGKSRPILAEHIYLNAKQKIFVLDMGPGSFPVWKYIPYTHSYFLPSSPKQDPRFEFFSELQINNLLFDSLEDYYSWSIHRISTASLVMVREGNTTVWQEAIRFLCRPWDVAMQPIYK
jgi:hypothetical protein